MRFDRVVPNIRCSIQYSARQSNDPCIVDENIDATKGLFYLCYGRSQCCPIRHIEPLDRCGSADFFQFRKHQMTL